VTAALTRPAAAPIVTIRTGGTVSAQGPLVARRDDGRLSVRIGTLVMSGWPVAAAPV
jgi:hypothetical protein